jgi:hypothetical protein
MWLVLPYFEETGPEKSREIRIYRSRVTVFFPQTIRLFVRKSPAKLHSILLDQYLWAFVSDGVLVV